MNPFLATDGYKIFHHLMSPEGTTKIYSNLTPRSFKHFPAELDYAVVFGIQMTVKEIYEQFETNFFGKNKEEVCTQIKKIYSAYSNTDYDVSKIEALHDLGYLPITIKALPEGTLVKANIPILTIYNTNDNFSWVTNFLETYISDLIWKPITSATIARQFRIANDKWINETDKWINETDEGNTFHSQFGCHDFSMRGLDSIFAVQSSGLGHALYHHGSDSLPVIDGAMHYYDVDDVVINSIPATEHSIQCAYYNGSDYNYIKTLIERFPTGPLGLVLDGFDLFKAITEDVPLLADQIKARTGGPVVFRPDSGNPADIICGIGTKYQDLSKWFPEGEVLPEYFEDSLLEEVREDTPHGECGPPNYENIYWVRGKLYKAKIHNICWNRYDKQYYHIDMWEEAEITIEELPYSPSDKGVIELLWDIFGGATNEQGFKVLDSCVRMIYGDAITLERFNEINTRLKAKGFASTNWVAGIGSFTYQFNTRDTLGIAVKSTYQEITVNGEIKGINIFKDPKTDEGTKKSAKGLLCVEKEVGTNDFIVHQECTWEQEQQGELLPVFTNGNLLNQVDFHILRERVNKEFL